MKNIIYILFILATMNMVGQSSTNHQFSSVPDTSRFEIVQSEQGARYTFKLDKYTGRTYQAVGAENGDLVWQEIEWNYSFTEDENPDIVNFQLMLSGLGARYTFMINVNNGLCWQLFNDPSTSQLWWKLNEATYNFN